MNLSILGDSGVGKSSLLGWIITKNTSTGHIRATEQARFELTIGSDYYWTNIREQIEDIKEVLISLSL
jgi:putative ribosome biogenesis GTPase RsgA